MALASVACLRASFFPIDRVAFIPWLRRVTFVPIQLMRMLSLIPGLAESSFPCLWFTPRLSDKVYAVSLLYCKVYCIGNTWIRLSLSCPRSYILINKPRTFRKRDVISKPIVAFLVAVRVAIGLRSMLFFQCSARQVNLSQFPLSRVAFILPEDWSQSKYIGYYYILNT